MAWNMGLLHWSTRQVLGAPLMPGNNGAKPRIRVGFTRQELDKYYMGWPGAAYDIQASQERYVRILEEAADKLGVVIAFEQNPLPDEEKADAFLRDTEAWNADGAMLVVTGLHPDGWTPVRRFVDQRDGLPTVIFSPQGTQFTPTLQHFRAIPNAFVGATPDVEWLSQGLRMLRAVWQMHNTRFAVIRGDEERDEKLEPVGVTLCRMPLNRFVEAYEATEGSEEAREIARLYAAQAREILEPNEECVLDAARTYVANRRLMDDTGCHAVTMDCLGLVTHQTTPPPCMAYMQLLNERTCGCCEADVNAGLSLLLSSYLLDKPAFLHNPSPDTVHNTYVGAHCTAPTKMDGFDAEPAEYRLRNHHESDWGVAPQVFFRENQPATMMKFLGPDALMACTGVILRNLDTQPKDGRGGCRTSFEMRVDDVANSLDIRGHHNVLIYGRHLYDFRAWGQLAGIRVEDITGRKILWGAGGEHLT